MNEPLGTRRRGRPLKIDSTYDYTREKLLWHGVAVLTEKGFSAVGLDEILRLARVPKGSFYHYFDSKEKFGLALVDAYGDYFAGKLDRWLADEATPPIQRLRNFIADARAGMARFDYRRGCLVGNLGQEMGVLPESFRNNLRRILMDWQDRTARCLRAAQAAGEVSTDLDCGQLAALFWIGWEGAVLRAKLDRSPTPLDIFAQAFLAALGH